MKVSLALGAVALVCLFSPARSSADVIIDWNNVMFEALRENAVNPLHGTRIMAMMHTAMFDAVNSIDDTHHPYHVNLAVSPGASREAAAAQAARDVLVSVFPARQATLDAALANSLSSIPDGAPKANGRAAGEQVAEQIIALRANDHSGDTLPYTPGTLPGQYRPTPPAFAPALLPHWRTVTPWSINSTSEFLNPAGTPALSSAEYAAELNEVKALGAVNSTTRTADQTESARVWAGGPGPVGHWHHIARTVAVAEGNTLSENARMFALLTLAEADGLIVTWENKYDKNFWRPVTAIQLADQDDNPATEADPDWLPLLVTPPYPSYTSGASTFSGASGEMLKLFFDNDNISFDVTVPGVGDRSFTSFSDASQETTDSRLWGGIHFRFEDEHGRDSGIEVSQFVFAKELRLIPEPGTCFLLVASLLAALLTPARRTAARVPRCVAD